MQFKHRNPLPVYALGTKNVKKKSSLPDIKQIAEPRRRRGVERTTSQSTILREVQKLARNAAFNIERMSSDRSAQNAAVSPRRLRTSASMSRCMPGVHRPYRSWKSAYTRRICTDRQRRRSMSLISRQVAIQLGRRSYRCCVGPLSLSLQAGRLAASWIVYVPLATSSPCSPHSPVFLLVPPPLTRPAFLDRLCGRHAAARPSKINTTSSLRAHLILLGFCAA